MTGTDRAGYPGQLYPTDTTSPFNMQLFQIKQFLANVRTATLVQVKNVTNTGAIVPVGSVDVQPIVNLIDSLGGSSPHGIIHNVPYFRLQGGTNAVVIDPAVGDIGIALFCDRDISSAKVNKKVSNPGSFRRFSMSDGLYIGGVLNGAPEQFVQFTSTGINIHDKNNNTIAMGSNGVSINGLLIDQNGNLTTPGGVQAGTGTSDAVALQTHTHPTAGTGAPSAPTPGT